MMIIVAQSMQIIAKKSFAEVGKDDWVAAGITRRAESTGCLASGRAE